MKPAETILEGLFDIRRQELRRVLLMSAYLLLIIAAYSVTKAVRDSLFVTKIGPAQLPYVYLLIAGAMGLVSMVYSRAVHRIGLHRLIRVTSVIAISNLLLFWLFRGNSSLWFYVLYVWASLFGAITASQTWLLASHVFNAREARRLFSRIGIGGILGGVFGGALTNRLAHWVGTEFLLVVCAAMVAATVVILEFGLKSPATPTTQPEPRRTGEAPTSGALLRQVWASRQLAVMVLVLSVGVIVEAFIDYEYKMVAKTSIMSKDQLTAFFGSITFYVGILALVFQLAFTNRILKRFGVGWAIQLLPAGLVVAFLTLGVRPTLWSAAFLQLVDGALSYSIHRSSTELLYLPIPPETRNSVKGFIDTFVDRAGRAAGAVLLLMISMGVVVSIPLMSFVAAGFAVIWIGLSIALKNEYLDSFRRALERKAIEPDAALLTQIDGATMRSLLRQLSSADERQVLYALDLLSHTHPGRWHDHIDLLIQHRSSAVRARTIAVLAGWNDPSIAREEFVHHPDYETARIAMASALRLNWNGGPRDREVLARLLHDSSLAVVREAMGTAGVVGYADAAPFLIDSLANRRMRKDAWQSLLKLGGAVVPELVRRLRAADEKPAVRKRVPKVLALTGAPEAAEALMASLQRLDYHLDFAVLKALNRMRVNWPDIELDRERITGAIATEREEYDKLIRALAALESNRTDDELFSLLLRALGERREERLDRLFRLVGLIYPAQDIASAYYNCRFRPALRPAAIEFLDNLLDPELRNVVVPLLEATFESEAALPVQPAAGAASDRGAVEFISFDAALMALASGGDPWVGAIARELQERMGEVSDDTRERRVIGGR